MTRLIAMLAAAALIGGSLAMDGAALAQGRSREARAEAPGQAGREARQPQIRQPQGREPQQRERQAREPQGNRDPRAGDYRDNRAYPVQREERRGYAPPPQAYREEARAARRGGYLPPAAGGGIVNDLNRYQLRAPPRGYAWVRVNGGFAMVQMNTGQIFDIVPD